MDSPKMIFHWVLKPLTTSLVSSPSSYEAAIGRAAKHLHSAQCNRWAVPIALQVRQHQTIRPVSQLRHESQFAAT